MEEVLVGRFLSKFLNKREVSKGMSETLDLKGKDLGMGFPGPLQRQMITMNNCWGKANE